MGILYVGYADVSAVEAALNELGSKRCREQVMFLGKGYQAPKGCAFLRKAPLGILPPKGGYVRLLDQSKEADRFLFSDDPLIQGADFQILVWGECLGSRFKKSVRSIPPHLKWVSNLRTAA